MTNTVTLTRPGYYPEVQEVQEAQGYEDDLAPYAALFLKPFTHKKCAFSKRELAAMCKDPMHSRKLILYLIQAIKDI